LTTVGPSNGSLHFATSEGTDRVRSSIAFCIRESIDVSPIASKRV
jgi:hypothetical protein